MIQQCSDVFLIQSCNNPVRGGLTLILWENLSHSPTAEQVEELEFSLDLPMPGKGFFPLY